MIDQETKDYFTELTRSNLPDGITAKIIGDELQITRSWFAKEIFFYLVFALFWNGLMFNIVRLASPWLLLTPHVWIGVWLIYKVVTGFVNITEISVNANALTIRHGPIPAFGNKKLAATEIRQLYVKEKENKNKNSTGYTYEIHIEQNIGKHERILKGLTAPKQAVYLEQVIEGFLGIEDKPVSGEFQLRRNIRGQAYARKDWETLAERHNLRFFGNDRLLEMTISGTYRDCNLKCHAFAEGNGRILNRKTRVSISRSDIDVSTKPFPVTQIDTVFNPGRSVTQRIAASVDFDVNDRQLTVQYDKLEFNIEYFEFIFDAFVDMLEAYPQILALGGEAVPHLMPIAKDKRHPYKTVAWQLIQDIGHQTQSLKPQMAQLVCKRCFSRCGLYQVEISFLDAVNYYGCRNCGQSHSFYQADSVAAVLDTAMTELTTQSGSRLEVNWLKHRTLFDFDLVGIANAAEKDIEQFAIQVSNDTDDRRKRSYGTMQCMLAPNFTLSPNSVRILERTFGQVIST